MSDLEILRAVKKALKARRGAVDAILKLGDAMLEYKTNLAAAREEAAKWRNATMHYKYGNQFYNDDFKLTKGEFLLWEKQ